jgi:hypothetical protein
MAMKLYNFLSLFLRLYRNFVKTQKGQSSDIARGSVKPLHKVQEDTESLKQMLAGLTSGYQRNGALADKLKADTAKVIQFCISMPLVPCMAMYSVSDIF